MKEEMNIYHAISEIQKNGKLPDYVQTITDFNPKLLVQLKGTYNHNYYKYDGIVILLEEGNDDNFLLYWVCDKDFNIINRLGFKYDDYATGLCNLDVKW